MRKKIKIVLTSVILTATIIAFVHYATTHPALLAKLQSIDPLLLVVLLGCYAIFFFALVLVLRASLHLYGKTMSGQENVLLSAYSSLVNFFGPGQSGPAFRGIYLKKKVDLPIKSYVYATLLYYVFYAVLSALLMFMGSRPWWQTLLLTLAVGIGSLAGIRWYTKHSQLTQEATGLRLVNLGLLFAATALQIICQAVIFYLELRSVQPGVSVSQVLAYTGAANFALFAALTPGAIGIREAFLVFTQQLHHLNGSVIIAANIIDRAVYIAFLGLLFVMVIGLHAKEKLQVKQITADMERQS